MNIMMKFGILLLTAVACYTNASEKVDERMAVAGATSISIENQQGKVVITGTEQDAVEVKGSIADEAERFVFERNGEQIIIKVVMPRHQRKNSWHSQGSTLMIQLPKTLRLDFSGISSDIELTGLSKSAKVNTVSGNIDAEQLSEYVELSTVSGDIRSRNLSGKVTLSTVSGDINDKASTGRLKLKAVSGNLTTDSSAKEVFINTVSGEIALTLKQVDELVISTVSGDVEGLLSLNDNGLLKMNSVSGDLDISFENNVQASFKMRANAGGQLLNSITKDKAQEAKYGPSSKLYFDTGNASASVKATTVSGRIKVSAK